MKRLYRRLVSSVAAGSVALAPLTGRANPLGGQVVGGSATIQGQSTSRVTVNQTTSRAIINWNTFNIAPGETTEFRQPDGASVTLNRVTGGTGASQIHGAINGNGSVYVVNPDGILFGRTATVNVGSFLATTHDIRNDDFMAGRNNFTLSGNPSASIVNQGTITAAQGGFAALVAPGVRNDGVITAKLGTVALASGNAFTLDLYGDSLIKLQASDAIAAEVRDVATGQPLGSLVHNTGMIRANGGRVQLSAVTARRAVDSVINTSGVIEANTVGTQRGMIVFGAATGSTRVADAPVQRVRVSGTVQAAGRKADTKGGAIQVTGEAIEVRNAQINASGMAGGGTVLIGGDTGGGRIDHSADHPAAAWETRPIPTATSVVVDNSTIDASATRLGNGGKVVVWADNSVSYAGSLFARGGPNGGDGGFAEVSGANLLDHAGLQANLSAPKGKAGLLLFDPVIENIGTAEAFQISSTLNNGTNVLVSADRININADINKTAGPNAQLTLSAIQLRIADNVTIGSSSGALPIFIRLRPLTDAASQQTVIDVLNEWYASGLSTAEAFSFFGSDLTRRTSAEFLTAFANRNTPAILNSFEYSVLTQAPITIGNNVRIYTNGGDINLETYSYSMRATQGSSIGYGVNGRTRESVCAFYNGCGAHIGVNYDNSPNSGADAVYGAERGIAYVQDTNRVVSRADFQIQSTIQRYNGVAAFNNYLARSGSVVSNSPSPSPSGTNSPGGNGPNAPGPTSPGKDSPAMGVNTTLAQPRSLPAVAFNQYGTFAYSKSFLYPRDQVDPDAITPCGTTCILAVAGGAAVILEAGFIAGTEQFFAWVARQALRQAATDAITTARANVPEIEIPAPNNVRSNISGQPRPPKNFVEPTNPPQDPPPIPEGYIAEPARNGKGIVYRKPGTTGDAGTIRVMEPTPQYPTGYWRQYNAKNQPMNPSTDKPALGQADSHIPLPRR